MKRNNKKGFTLAELLIVVAIIAVLVAVAIPVFTSQLETAKERTDEANVRSAYGEAVSAYLGDGSTDSVSLGGVTYTVSADGGKVTVTGPASGMQSAKYKAKGIKIDDTGIKVNS